MHASHWEKMSAIFTGELSWVPLQVTKLPSSTVNQAPRKHFNLHTRMKKALFSKKKNEENNFFIPVTELVTAPVIKFAVVIWGEKEHYRIRSPLPSVQHKNLTPYSFVVNSPPGNSDFLKLNPVPINSND